MDENSFHLGIEYISILQTRVFTQLLNVYQSLALVK